QYGAPSAPRDLLTKPCVRIRFPSGVMPAWEFERDGVTTKIEPEARLVTTSLSLLLRAALDGVGFCSAFEGQVREHIAAGRLVSVMEDWLPPFPAPFLYYPSRDVPSALRAFIDFMKQRAS
ncbi:MAG: LysR family transcriptional regulator, partial [Burkholderiales bacterium]